jgi:hypothetical protein
MAWHWENWSGKHRRIFRYVATNGYVAAQQRNGISREGGFIVSEIKDIILIEEQDDVLESLERKLNVKDV